MKALLRGAVQRPVAVTMVVASVFVFGLISYGRLDLSLLPRLSYPTLTVRTKMDGAGPRDVDQRLTDVLEKRLATTGGLVSMTSVSRTDLSDITLQFRWDTDMNEVRAEIDAKLDAATLPRDAARPLVLPYDPNLDPILRLAVSARGTTEQDLALARKMAEEVERELKKLPGVAAARIRGGREREIAVQLDEEALTRSGISIAAVAQALRRANRNEAAGIIEEGPIEYVVRSVNELRDAQEIADLVVARVDGAAVRVRDLARVQETYREREMAAFVDGKEAVLVEVYKKADANLVAVAREVRERISGGPQTKKAPPSRMGRRGHRRGRRAGGGGDDESLSSTLGEWVSIRVLTDQSRFIEAAIREVRDTALLGGILAVFVLYLFLARGLPTLIAGGVIGICVVATFTPLFLADISLNIMSLGGLALGIGMLVDNAIVVLEAASRKREEGRPPLEAAIEGVSDVAGAITASTLTTVCVFFPIVFVEKSGIAGQVFRDLALSVVFAILASLFVALFVIPTCLAHFGQLAERPPLQRRLRKVRLGWAGRLLGDRVALGWLKLRRKSVAGKLESGLWMLLSSLLSLLGRLAGGLVLVLLGVGAGLLVGLSRLGRLVFGPLARGWGAAYAVLENAYVPFLRGCMQRKGAVLGMAAAALVFAGWRAQTLSPDLIPESMTGEFEVRLSFPPGFPLEKTVERLRPVQHDLRGMPEVEWVALTAGVEDDVDRPSDEGEHTARLTVHLRRSERIAQAERRVRARVEQLVRAVPDLQPPEFQASALFAFAVPVRVLFRGTGRGQLGRLSQAAEDTAQELRRVPGVESVRADLGRGAREVNLVFDRDELMRHDLTPEQVAMRLQSKIRGQVPTSLVEGSVRTDVRVRLHESDRSTLSDLLSIDVSQPGAATLPLGAVLLGKPVVAEGPGEIRRVDGRYAAVLTVSYKGFDLEGLSLQATRIAQEAAARYGVEAEVVGRSREARKSLQSLLGALLLATFLVYAVMAAQFESLTQPLLIMFSLPLAGVGAVAALDLLGLSLSVVVLLGAILLAGIAVNNAIVLVDCANKRRLEGLAPRDAILQAGRERLRPILMTTATTVLGLLPLTGALAAIPGLNALPFGLGGGEAVELRAPMAITVIGGLLTSTLLTLVVIPVMYDVLGRKKTA